MNRAKKCCVYRNCEVNSHSNPERTLFQFPKDEERASKWCLAGAVDPIETGPLFMCDLHFSRIYMCFSARRKMLLNMAVPKPYGVTDNEDESDLLQSSSEQAHNSSLEMTVEEHLDESMIHETEEVETEIIYSAESKDYKIVEKSSKQSAKKHPSSESTKGNLPMKLIKLQKLPYAARSTVVSSSTPSDSKSANSTLSVESSVGPILRKIKLKKRPVVDCIKDTKKEKLNQEQPKPAVSNIEVELMNSTVKTKPERKSIIPKSSPASQATPSVTTSSKITYSAKKSHKKDSEAEDSKDDSIYEFIFKGEEYIQLPKAKYFSEKKDLETKLHRSESERNQLHKKLEYYRSMVKDLKEFLNALQEENIE
ncbi:uncharacterized protein LOC131432265 [Malaya genurostris]|uniref:uncharacterized protein LOC131432265 n=1 Tax=Malaya genurostris TaxID=325434 RepID=UPI0026F3F32D|nr:uncharacterized protein LOC131432265 [Malaya genurostris]